MTPQGCPSRDAGKQGKVFRSPSSPEEDPPKTNFVEKGYEPDCKTYVPVVILRVEKDIFTEVPLVTYGSVDGWPPCGHCAVKTPFGAGPPGEGFFPCLETSASKSSEATLFFP